MDRKYNMLNILTKEQAEKSEKEMDKILLSLDFNTKSSLVSLLKPLMRKIYCDHDWVDTDSYENDLPKNTLFCKKCFLLKDKN